MMGGLAVDPPASIRTPRAIPEASVSMLRLPVPLPVVVGPGDRPLQTRIGFVDTPEVRWTIAHDQVLCVLGRLRASAMKVLAFRNVSARGFTEGQLREIAAKLDTVILLGQETSTEVGRDLMVFALSVKPGDDWIAFDSAITVLYNEVQMFRCRNCRAILPAGARDGCMHTYQRGRNAVKARAAHDMEAGTISSMAMKMVVLEDFLGKKDFQI
jgi:hypothetical protein